MESETAATLLLFGSGTDTSAAVSRILQLPGDEAYEVGDEKSTPELTFDVSLWSISSLDHQDEIRRHFGDDFWGPLRWIVNQLADKGRDLAALARHYDIEFEFRALNQSVGQAILIPSDLLSDLGRLGLDLRIYP